MNDKIKTVLAPLLKKLVRETIDGKVWEKSCRGKRQYASFEEAEAARVRHQKPRDRRYLKPYLCQYCKSWHLGHLPSHMRVQQQRR